MMFNIAVNVVLRSAINLFSNAIDRHKIWILLFGAEEGA